MLYADGAAFIPTQHSQLRGVASTDTTHANITSHIADTSDPHGSTLTQTTLDVINLTVHNPIIGSVTVSIAQTNGTGSDTLLTDATIDGGTLTGKINLPQSSVWESAGNLGIGTTTPPAKLTVQGHMMFSNGNSYMILFNSTYGVSANGYG